MYGLPDKLETSANLNKSPAKMIKIIHSKFTPLKHDD